MFEEGDIVRRKKFLGMTLIQYNKSYKIVEVNSENPLRTYIRLEGLPRNKFSISNFDLYIEEHLPEDLFHV